MQSASKITLGYWNIRGIHRGNPTRYMLAYSQANWEEKTYKVMSGDWRKVKRGSDFFMEFPNLPYIIDGDFRLSETVAVREYIASKYCPGLLGGNSLKQRARAI